MLSQWRLQQIARTIKAGGVIAYPTESVYGLGCHPDNPLALQRILNIKARSAAKGLIILVSRLQQAVPYIQDLSQTQIEQLTQPSSRATTWLIAKSPQVLPLLSGRHTKLAVRISQHPVVQSICDHLDMPIVSTSCNLSGKPNLTNAQQVRNHMKLYVDDIIDGQCGGQRPSKIVDLTSGKVLRD